MIVAIHQPNYLPFLGYFHKMSKCDLFVLLDNVQYVKRYYIQRVKIKTPTGADWLGVPVLNHGRYDQLINATEIDQTQSWRERHWKTLSFNYAKAPFFDRYTAFFQDAYVRRWEKLGDLNEYLIRYLTAELGIKVELVKASQLNTQGQSNELLISICKEVGATTYLSGNGARDYLAPEKFANAGIELTFDDFKHPVYPQQHGEFVSYLSTVDLLFNCGPESLSILTSGKTAHVSSIAPE